MIGRYIWLFLIAVLPQVFLFNSLSISELMVLHIYPIFILALPINTSQIRVLLLSTILGITLDFLCAGAGLYTITAAASGMCRASILKLMLRRREVIDAAAPSPRSLEMSGYLLYVALFMGISMGIFLGVESLGFENSNFVVARYVVSLICSTALSLLLLHIINIDSATSRNHG